MKLTKEQFHYIKDDLEEDIGQRQQELQCLEDILQKISSNSLLDNVQYATLIRGLCGKKRHFEWLLRDGRYYEPQDRSDAQAEIDLINSILTKIGEEYE